MTVVPIVTVNCDVLWVVRDGGRPKYRSVNFTSLHLSRTRPDSEKVWGHVLTPPLNIPTHPTTKFVLLIWVREENYKTLTWTRHFL